MRDIKVLNQYLENWQKKLSLNDCEPSFLPPMQMDHILVL